MGSTRRKILFFLGAAVMAAAPVIAGPAVTPPSAAALAPALSFSGVLMDGLIAGIRTAPCLFGGALPAAGKPEVLVELGRRKIYEGESVLYQVTVNNAENPPPPDLGAFTDFFVKFLGSQDINSVSYSFINGRRSEFRRYGRIFRYRLTPKRAGTLTVPAPVAEVGGKEIRGRPLTLEVVAPEEQDLALLSVKADKEHVYLLQPFTVTLEILVKALPDPYGDTSPVSVQDPPPALSIPWVDAPEGLEASLSPSEWLSPLVSRREGFTINGITSRADSLFAFFDQVPLARFSLRAKRVKRPGASGEEEDYYDYTLSREFKARKVGEYTFGPVTLKGAFAASVSAAGDFLGRDVYVLAPPVTVVVSDAPLEGRPATYTGAVGRFTFRADLKPREARVGDPVTLTLTLEGRGTLDRARAPKIAEVPEVARDFKVYEATEETKGSRRIFTYSIRPKNAGITAFPPVALSYFDVERERFVTLRTDPVPMTVEAAESLEAKDIVSGAAPAAGEKKIETQRGGIFADAIDLAEVRNERVRPELFALLFAGMFAFYWISFFGVRALRKRFGDPAVQRRRAAAGRAEARLKEAQRLLGRGETAAAMDRIREALAGFVGDVTGTSPEGMTHRDLEEGLVRLGLDGEKARRLARIQEACEAARFGVPEEGSVEIAASVRDAFSEAVRDLRRAGRLK